MTQNHALNAEHAVNAAANGNAVGRTPDPAPQELGELLDRVCDIGLRFLVDAPCLPRNLRMRAGHVSMDLEWAGEQAVIITGPSSASVAPVAAPASDPESSVGYLTAPTVGVFYRAPEPGAAPFVSVGDAVVVGQQVGIVEAMKLMIPVEAERAGRIAEVLTEDGEPVEYGDRLFVIHAVDPS